MINKILMLRIVGGIYLISGFVLLFDFIPYILGNIISLVTRGELVQQQIDELDNFYFDTMVLFFYLSSLVFTAIQFVQWMYPSIERTGNIGDTDPLGIIKHISSDDEIAVLDAVRDLGPRVYKFEIAQHTGLSRMKVHRIIHRLVQRDILKIIEVGRNRRIDYSDWLSSLADA